MSQGDPFFHKVMLDHVGAESIDRIYEERGLEGERADYLMRARSVVVELKELKDPPKEQLFNLVWPYAHEVGLGPGLVDVEDVVRRSPRSAELTALLDDINTKRLRRDIEDAQGQIRATKRTLKLNSAVGLVLVINVSNVVIAARNIMEALLRQMARGQEHRFEAVQHVMVLSVHHVISDGPHKGRVCVFGSQHRTPAERRAADAALEIMDKLQHVAAPNAPGDRALFVSDGKGPLPVAPRRGTPIIAPAFVTREEIQKAAEEQRGEASDGQGGAAQAGA